MKIKELRENHAKINKAYGDVFNTPDGIVVLEDLEKIFAGRLLKKSDGVVDANACIASIGAFNVIQHIKDRKHDGELAR